MSNGYVTSLARAMPQNSMSAIEFADSCRTPRSSLDRARGRRRQRMLLVRDTVKSSHEPFCSFVSLPRLSTSAIDRVD